jgi:acylphosphatase
MGDPTDKIRLHVRITGLVQGVGYRYFACTAARRLNLTGWVRNRVDGSVEVEAQGTRDAVTRFLAQLGHGPRWAQVNDVDATPVELHLNDSTGFRVKADRRV